MKNKKGFVGILSLLIVVVIAGLLIFYFTRHNWFGAPSINGKPADQNKDINAQLDDLRSNVKGLQDAKDKEIMDALK